MRFISVVIINYVICMNLMIFFGLSGVKSLKCSFFLLVVKIRSIGRCFWYRIIIDIKIFVVSMKRRFILINFF